MFRYSFIVAGIGLVMSLCVAGRADELILNNGSTIVGEVDSLAGGKVTIKTEFSGDLTIDAGQIKGVSTDQPMTVQLDGGDRAVGKLMYSDQEGQRVTSSGVGDVRINLGGVSGIWAGGKESPEVVAMRQALAKNPWSVKLGVGVDGQTGNTDRISTNIKLDILRETDDDRLSIYTKVRHSREDSDDTVKEVKGGLKLEVDINEKWFTFAKLDLEFDEIENVDMRVNLTAGVGYFVIQEPDTEFKVRAGAGFQHETFGNGVTDDQGVIELGWDFEHKLAPRLVFTHSATIYPGLGNIRDTRASIENALEIPLTDDEIWKLRLSVSNDYDVSPEPGVKRLDTYYALSVVWVTP